jgi:hypothetical protein
MAAPRLNVNPNLQVCPTFGADEFAVHRNALAACLNITAKQAVESLEASHQEMVEGRIRIYMILKSVHFVK